MSPAGRALFVEAIFDAFRHRGESSEDAAEAAGTTLDAIARDDSGIQALFTYAKSNPGLLKEAAILLIEQHPEMVSQLAPPISNGIAQRLLDR
jgi:hypothetical protein